ncbi:MAG: hypothetical protein KGL39_20345 [Patescibacteria group bacterium]|nr:hypothetical protein [Patescibacteria group bacterium]
MPVMPPSAGSAYDTATTILNMTRARLNDELKTLQPTSGKLLDLGNANTQQIFNNSWRRSQDYLAEKGYARLINEVIISQFPVVASSDPASQCWLSWAGCSDGVNDYTTPQLPAGFNHPLKIWERWSNQNAEFSITPMEKCLDGLPAWQKTTAIRFWEWRNDAIYMPGSQMIEDLRIRHAIFMPDIIDIGTTPWWQQQVPIVRISDGLSWMICAEVARARGDATAAQEFTDRGEAGLVRVFNLDVKADQRVNVRRRPRSGRGFAGPWY